MKIKNMFILGALICTSSAVLASSAPIIKTQPKSQTVNEGSSVTFSVVAENGSKDFTIPISGNVNLDMVWIEPGTFMMGSPEGEIGWKYNEPVHQVTLTKGFWAGKYEVTQAQYMAIMGTNPSQNHGVGDNYPVYYVNWFDAMEFCERLTEIERKAGRLPAGYEYTLPTEAQWEYTCRAGTTTAFNNGKDITSDENCPNADEVAWYSHNSDNQAHPVGQKLPNAWGLYDMHANVSEWCLDGNSGLDTNPAVDPLFLGGWEKVGRGGSYCYGAQTARSGFRGGSVPEGTRGPADDAYGFRVFLTTVQAQASAAADTLTYQWYKDGKAISGATASSYTIKSVKASDAGKYTVKVSNSAGSVTSSAATLTVNVPVTLSSITINGSSSVNVGSTATYTCTATYSKGTPETVTPTWSISSGTNYASISSKGILKGKEVGTAEVKASYEGKTATMVVSIKDPDPDPDPDPSDLSASRSFSTTTPNKGETLDVSVTITSKSTITSLYVSEELPKGWSFDSMLSSGLGVTPSAGQTGEIEFLWLTKPDLPYTLKYRVKAPDTKGIYTWLGNVKWRITDNEKTGTIRGDSTVEIVDHHYHTADYNHDYKISLSPELTRVVQFYNTGGYHNASGTEDGYAPGTGTITAYHDSDYSPKDGKISLSPELTRLVQFYNTGGYHIASGTEDGFAPGAASGVTSVHLAAAGGTLKGVRTFNPSTYRGSPTIDVSIEISVSGQEDISSLYVSEVLPEGWTFDSMVTSVPVNMYSGASRTLELVWIDMPTLPYTLTYRVKVPSNAKGDYTWSGNVKWRATEGEKDVVTGGTTAIREKDPNPDRVLVSIVISGSDSVNVGSTATYTCTAEYSDGSTNKVNPEWSFSPINSVSITPTGVTFKEVGTVTVTASYTEGEVTRKATKKVEVKEVPVPPTITTQPKSQTVNEGSSLTFTVVATGTAPLSYQWYKGSSKISGATSASYTINPVKTTDEGSYKVVVTNIVGSVTSNAATLKVIPDPDPNGTAVRSVSGNSKNSATVKLTLKPDENVSVIFVEERVPAGVTISVNNGGTYTASKNMIRWSSLDGSMREVSYVLTVADDFVGEVSLSGEVTFDERTVSVTGDRMIQFPIFLTHPADMNNDWEISTTEVSSYALAWTKGQSWSREPADIPVLYVSRAAMIWVNGGYYDYDPGKSEPSCWVSTNVKPASVELAADSVNVRTINVLEGKANVSVEVIPADGVSIYFVEEQLPAGMNLNVTNISDGGKYVEDRGLIRWSFLDGTLRTLTYTMEPEVGFKGVIPVNGEVTFDEETQATSGDVEADFRDNPAITYVLKGETLILSFTGTLYESDDAINWRIVEGAKPPFTVDTSKGKKFYRSVK